MTLADVVFAAMDKHEREGERRCPGSRSAGQKADDLARSLGAPRRMVRRALELHLEPAGLVERYFGRWRIADIDAPVAYDAHGAVVRPEEGGGDFPGG